VDVCLLIRQRLEELGLEQQGLAAAHRSHGVLHFPAADSEEIAASAWRNRYLWENGEVFEGSER